MSRKKKTLAQFAKELKKIQPDLILLSEYKNADVKVMVANKYGICMCNPNSLLRGRKPTIKTSLNKTLYFKNQLKEVNPNLKLLGNFINSRTKVLVKNKYGVCSVLPYNLLRSNITIDSALNKTEYFINKSKEIHGNKYDYSLVEYIGTKNKATIICPIHGEFLQAVSGHLRGYGCPKCSFSENPGGYNITLAERNKQEWLNIPAVIYLIKCYNSNEEFYKIGITVNAVKERFRQLPYKYKIIQIKETNLYNAIYLEQERHNHYKNYKYTPKIQFGGYTECFKK